MTPEQAIEKIAFTCISRDPDGDGSDVLEEIHDMLEREFPLLYAAAKSKFDITVRKVIEQIDQLEPGIREEIFDHFGR
jgi:hypothetical protein